MSDATTEELGAAAMSTSASSPVLSRLVSVTVAPATSPLLWSVLVGEEAQVREAAYLKEWSRLTHEKTKEKLRPPFDGVVSGKKPFHVKHLWRLKVVQCSTSAACLPRNVVSVVCEVPAWRRTNRT